MPHECLENASAETAISSELIEGFACAQMVLPECCLYSVGIPCTQLVCSYDSAIQGVVGGTVRLCFTSLRAYEPYEDTKAVCEADS